MMSNRSWETSLHESVLAAMKRHADLQALALKILAVFPRWLYCGLTTQDTPPGFLQPTTNQILEVIQDLSAETEHDERYIANKLYEVFASGEKLPHMFDKAIKKVLGAKESMTPSKAKITIEMNGNIYETTLHDLELTMREDVHGSHGITIKGCGSERVTIKQQPKPISGFHLTSIMLDNKTYDCTLRG